MAAYGSFAYFYDKLQHGVDYEGMARQIDAYVEKFGGRRGILLDAACGTGTLCEKLAAAGYDVVGIDGSDEMLNAALDKKFESGSRIQYLRQDMKSIDMYGTIDVTVCTLDSVNHLENEDEVRAFFERVSLFAYPDGMFIFDVNTPYKHREVLADNAFIYDMEGLYCGWQNEYDKTDSSVSIYLDFFEKTEKGYERYSESFREIAVEIPRVEELLSQTGFEILGVYDGYSEAPLAENSERAVFVCRKICEDN